MLLGPVCCALAFAFPKPPVPVVVSIKRIEVKSDQVAAQVVLVNLGKSAITLYKPISNVSLWPYYYDTLGQRIIEQSGTIADANYNTLDFTKLLPGRMLEESITDKPPNRPALFMRLNYDNLNPWYFANDGNWSISTVAFSRYTSQLLVQKVGHKLKLSASFVWPVEGIPLAAGWKLLYIQNTARSELVLVRNGRSHPVSQMVQLKGAVSVHSPAQALALVKLRTRLDCQQMFQTPLWIEPIFPRTYPIVETAVEGTGFVVRRPIIQYTSEANYRLLLVEEQVKRDGAYMARIVKELPPHSPDGFDVLQSLVVQDKR
ncbi:MAG: hypothetical protein ACHQ50_10235 [Fimbriimonadales bacterium]